MGVKNLNSIIKTTPVAGLTNVNTIIFDGSNAIITSIYSSVSALRKAHSLDQWNSIDKDVIFQLKFIVEKTIANLTSDINNFVNKYHPTNIFFVMDPKEKIDYTITKDMDMNENYRDILFKNGDSITIKLKEEEQAARKKSSSKQIYIDSKSKDILDVYENPVVVEIFKQSYHFQEPCNSIKIMKLIIFTIVNLLSTNTSFNLINSKDEADLVIKNIGASEAEAYPESNILVCSTDTDYSILFSDTPNIYISGLRTNTPIFNPNLEWKKILISAGVDYETLDDETVYNYAIRFAPIFQNDYTRESLIQVSNTCCSELLGKHNEYISKNKNTYKVMHNDKNAIIYNELHKNNSTLLPEQLDDIVYNYNENYFMKYAFSTVMYKNWRMFGDYSIDNNVYDVDDCIKYILNGMLLKYKNIYTFIYTINKELFMNYVKTLFSYPENTIDEVFQYYKELDINNTDITYYGGEFDGYGE